MAFDFNDLEGMAKTLQEVQKQTMQTATAGTNVQEAQVEATNNLAVAIEKLATAICMMAERHGL